MSFTTYDTQVLLGVLRTLYTPSSFWLDKFFASEQTFEQEYIDFDILVGGRRMAPFVAPTVQGKPMLAQGYTTKRFKPAYVKPKDVIDPQRIIKRRAGEPFMGSMSLQARFDAVTADSLQEQKNQIYRRWEWMACQAIVTGQVIVAGDDYPTQTVLFGRNAANTITQSGTSLWTDTVNSDPIADIEAWTYQIQTATGFVPDQLTMGLNAWKAYRKHPKVTALLSTIVRNSQDAIRASALSGDTSQYVGQVGLSTLPIFVYNDIYEDNTSTLTSPVNVPYLDPTKVVLTASTGIGGIRCFGAILDAKAGFAPASIFPKQWQQEDPSVTYLMSQSAPLMVPTRPDCTLAAKVV
jgi:hypothetical protein